MYPPFTDVALSRSLSSREDEWIGWFGVLAHRQEEWEEALVFNQELAKIRAFRIRKRPDILDGATFLILIILTMEARLDWKIWVIKLYRDLNLVLKLHCGVNGIPPSLAGYQLYRKRVQGIGVKRCQSKE
ncbi:hypothetical protein IW262DRAFT_1297420 [Armillaria fumosa]|nr:hypothetical protein IW262DRAFT_1297420 [Armillaria fumosa]